MQEYETDDRPYPVCPHCGNIDKDWWDGTSLQCDGDTETQSCGNCGEEYDITINIEYVFSTEKQGDVL